MSQKSPQVEPSAAAANVGPPSKLDRWGAFTSAACAVHCLIFALLPGVISALGLGIVFVPAVEWSLVLTALVIASSALFFGWRRHRSIGVLIAFLVGASGLIASRAFEEFGVEGFALPVGVVGAAALVFGHFLNARRSAACA